MVSRRWVINRVAVLVGVACVGLISTAAQLPRTAFLEQQPAGRILFVRLFDLWIWEEGSARRLTSGQVWRQPQWSPDGGRIAFVYESNYFSDIYVMASTGGEFERLTRGQSGILEENVWSMRPSWSPEGQRLTYLSDAVASSPRLWIVNADGSGKRQLPIRPAFFATAVDTHAWAPSGDQLAVTIHGQQAPSQIIRYDLSTGASQPLTEFVEGAFDPAWSPNGRWLAFVAREGGKARLYLAEADGANPRRFDQIGSSRSPTWSPDGRSLVFLSGRSGSFEVWVADVLARPSGVPSLANPRQLTHDLGVDALSGLSVAK